MYALPKRIFDIFYSVSFYFTVAFFIIQCKPSKDIQNNVVSTISKNDSNKTVQVNPTKKDTVVISEPAVLNIGFLMPFALSENLQTTEGDLQTEELIPSSIAYLEFYEGAKMATDSLNHDSIKINLKIYDTYDSLTSINIVNNPYVYANSFIFASNPVQISTLIKNAEKYKSPVIWTQSSSIKSRQLMLIQPNNQSMISSMANYLAKHFADAKITVLFRDTKKEKELGDWFAAQIDTAIFKENGDSLKVMRINYSNVKTNGLLSKLSKTKKNLIVVTSSDEAFISPLVKVLNDTLDVYNIQLCGLPTWEYFESVNFKELQQLQTLIFSNNYLDYSDAELTNFRKAFIEKYATDPLYQAYQGFFLMKTIMKTKRLKEDWASSLNNANFKSDMFKFNSKNESYGYENTFINVLKFDQNTLIKQ